MFGAGCELMAIFHFIFYIMQEWIKLSLCFIKRQFSVSTRRRFDVHTTSKTLNDVIQMSKQRRVRTRLICHKLLHFLMDFIGLLAVPMSAWKALQSSALLVNWYLVSIYKSNWCSWKNEMCSWKNEMFVNVNSLNTWYRNNCIWYWSSLISRVIVNCSIFICFNKKMFDIGIYKHRHEYIYIYIYIVRLAIIYRLRNLFW